jgi:hypothetical protein
LDANLSYYDRNIYFVGVDSVSRNQLVVMEMNANTGAVLGSTPEPQPGTGFFPEEVTFASSNGTVYAVGELGANAAVESLRLQSGGGVLWNRNVTIPGNTGWSTGEPVLHADAKGIAAFMDDQSRVYEFSFLADGSPGYVGFLPGEVFGSANRANDTFLSGTPVIGGSVYYLSGSDASTARVYGANFSDGKLVANFSVAAGVKDNASIEGLSEAHDKLMVSYGQGTTAFDPRGNVLWSLRVQNGGGQMDPLAISNGLIFLQRQSSEVYFLHPSSSGPVYDASYLIVNSSSGHVLWSIVYSPWINAPPWTPAYPDSLPSYVVGGSSNGLLLVQGKQSLYGVELSRLV